MNKWYNLLIVAVIGLGLINGCGEPQTPEQLIAKSSDKAMMKAFSKPGVAGKSEHFIDYSPSDLIRMRTSIGNSHYGMGSARGSYSSKYDASRDKIAQEYIKVAKARGNTVKLYKTFINNQIARKIVHPFLENGNSAVIPKYDLDPALIEFDKNGRIVSMLVRRHYFTPIGHGFVAQQRDSIIILGNTARKMEMSISNNTLNNGYIATL